MAAPAPQKPDIAPADAADVTLDTGPVEEPYVPPEPTDKQLKAAKAVLKELTSRGEAYSPGDTVAALLQVVDVVDPFRTPEHWPADEEDEYAPAPVVAQIVKALSRGASKHIRIKPSKTLCLWRNKDKWMDGDRPKRGATAKLDTRTQHLLEGAQLVIEVNFHHWLGLNPLQKVQTIYRLLRERDEDAGKRRPDFVGYLDEVEIFGLRTFHDMVALEFSLAKAKEVTHPHQLPFPEWE